MLSSHSLSSFRMIRLSVCRFCADSSFPEGLFFKLGEEGLFCVLCNICFLTDRDTQVGTFNVVLGDEGSCRPVVVLIKLDICKEHGADH